MNPHRGSRVTVLAVICGVAASALGGGAVAGPQNPPAVAVVDPTAEAFQVTYVAAGVLYLNGGSDSGLEEGMRLSVRRRAEGASLGEGEPVAEIVIFAVTSRSAACQIESQFVPVQEGDVAYLPTGDRVRLEARRAEEPLTSYAQVVSFTTGDPLEEEIREFRPRPPLPEINRVRGRIGFDYGAIRDQTPSGGSSDQRGLYLRADFTRIAGSHWNLTGYWRGRLNQRTQDPQQETLTDLTNRVYHIGLYYNNPDSRYVAGVGRLLVPWASSLSTLDGGYFGRRLGRATTLGAFAGSTPDPTAWNYDPDRQMFGGFVNLERGSFETLRSSTTAGVALTRQGGAAERRFLFLENSLQFGSRFSVYHNLEADENSQGYFSSPTGGIVLSRSFLTVRVRPVSRVTFDLNHNHFRVVPTFDPRLGGGGLLDDLLFEGISGGVRVEAYPGVAVYSRLGRSDRADDSDASVNQMYGLTFSRLPAGLRVDARYSVFDGPFGEGTYRSGSLSYSGDAFRFDVQLGDQEFRSGIQPVSDGRYVNANMDWLVGNQIVLGGGTSVYRGNNQHYDQIFFSIGYVFGPRRPEG